MTVMVVTSKQASETVKNTMKDFSKIIETFEETSFDLKKKCHILEKYMDINDCDKAIYFEITKRIQKVYFATNNISIRFIVHSIESIFDLSTINNYHKYGGHVMCFSHDFEEDENLKIAKNIFEQIFEQKNSIQKERALCFYYTDGKIFLRNYLIEGMQEIGPRMDLEIDTIINGCFKGNILYTKKLKEE